MTKALTRTRRHSGGLIGLLRMPVKTLKFFFSRRAPWGPRLATILALAYVVMPVDLIPDVAPILGWLDDAGAVGLALGWLMKSVSDFDEAPPETAEPPSKGQATAAFTSS